jgi:hypothetical protein
MAPPALHVEVEADGGTAECRVMTVAPDADATFEGLTHMAVHKFRVRGVNAVGPGSWSEPSRPQGHTGEKVRASYAARRTSWRALGRWWWWVMDRVEDGVQSFACRCSQDGGGGVVNGGTRSGVGNYRGSSRPV